MSEADLIKAAQRGDRDALIQLLRKIEVPLYRTAYYLLGNEQDALDATQEALIRIYTRIDTFREQAQFKTWAQRIVTNICMDKFRKQKETVSIDEHTSNLPSTSNVEDQVVSTGLVENIREAINQLPEHFKQVVIMRYIQEFSYHEIAETLDLPLNTVKSHLFRARKLLQSMLHEYEEGGVRG